MYDLPEQRAKYGCLPMSSRGDVFGLRSNAQELPHLQKGTLDSNLENLILVGTGTRPEESQRAGLPNRVN